MKKSSKSRAKKPQRSTTLQAITAARDVLKSELGSRGIQARSKKSEKNLRMRHPKVDLDTSLPVLAEKFKSDLQDFDNLKVRGGIFGIVKAGKSSLLNAIAGRKVAEVSVTRCTGNDGKPLARYSLSDGLEIQDLPGIDAGWPVDGYDRKLKKEAGLSLSEFDFFIYLLRESLQEPDVQMLRILQKKGANIYYVQSKLDQHIEDGKSDGDSPENTMQKLRQSIKQELKIHDLNTEKVYLVSARQPRDFELPHLIEDIHAELSDGKKRDKFILQAVGPWSDKILGKKREAVEKLATKYAVLAAANGFNPILGLDVAVDLALLGRLGSLITESYGLDESNLKFWMNDKAKNQSHIRARIAMLTETFLKSDGIKLFFKSMAPKVIGKNFTKWIPFVGQAVAAGVGYKLTQSYASELIDRCETEASALLHHKVLDGDMTGSGSTKASSDEVA